MRALQVTEERQRSAESRLEEEKGKNQVMGRLVRQLCEQVV